MSQVNKAMSKSNKALNALKSSARPVSALNTANPAKKVRLGAGLTMSILDDINGRRPTLTMVKAGSDAAALSTSTNDPSSAPFALLTPKAAMLDALKDVAAARTDREKALQTKKTREDLEMGRQEEAREAYARSTHQSLAERSAMIEKLPGKLKAIEEEAKEKRVLIEAADFEALQKWKADVSEAKAAQKASLDGEGDGGNEAQLRARIEELEEALRVEKARADYWERKYEELRTKTCKQKEADGDAASLRNTTRKDRFCEIMSRLIDPEYQPTPVEALEWVEAVSPTNVVILPSAWESAGKMKDFARSRRLFDLLHRLALQTTGAFLRVESLEKACRFSPNEYAATEYPQTLARPGAKEARTFEWLGRRYLMQKHLRIGVADDRRHTIRVHFEWDRERKCLIIGWCGEHLPV